MPEAPEPPEDSEAGQSDLDAAGIGREHGPQDETTAVEAIRYDMLRRARGIYERAIDERWVKVNIHGEMACPVCGAVVADTAGKLLHRKYHRGEAPSLGPILAELEDLAEVLRGLAEEQR